MEPNIKNICNYLDSKGVVYSKSVEDSNLITHHKLGEFEVEIRAEIPKNFPCDLPIFHLVNRDKFGSLAHVAWGDGDYADICYGKNNNLSADLHAPEKVFYAALTRALSILEKSLSDEDYNHSELKREFAGVWRFHIKSSNTLICIAEASEKAILLNIRSSVKKGKGIIQKSVYAIDPDSPCNEKNYFIRNSQDKERNLAGKGVLLPISPLLIPPAPTESIKTWWIKQLGQLTQKRQRELKKLLKKSATKEFYILCHAQNNGDTIWFAIQCNSDNKKYAPLTVKNCDAWSFKAIHINVISRELLIPRGGGSTDLGNAKVCIVGCGSVGGYIADMIVSSGVGNLTLVDNDLLEIENLHRHILDPLFLYWNKSEAMKFRLVNKYPFVNVEAIHDDFLNIDEIDFWKDFDVVIVAIGAASHERKFNEFVIENKLETKVVTTWVEPFGIGGHAVATASGKKGCLACAYVNNETDQPDIYPNLSFVEPNQPILQTIGGCGTEFIAFSSVDAIHTATIASKLSLKAIKEDLQCGIAVSWRSQSKTAKEKGILFTHRYLRMRGDFQEVEIARESCLLCTNDFHPCLTSRN